MDSPHRSDSTIPDIFAHQACPLRSLSLVAHLGSNLVFACSLGKPACLVYRVGQRFFTINMLAPLDSGYRRHGVYMARRGHDHPIDVLTPLSTPYARVPV